MDGQKLHYTLSLRVYGEEKCFGPGLAELLERVETDGSLRKATAGMGMAYSKAWRIVRTAERSLGFPLLNATTGGRDGGGAVLTDYAKRFLDAYRQFERAVRGFADQAFTQYIGR